MKTFNPKSTTKPYVQLQLFPAAMASPKTKFISVYRISLVKDESVSFGKVRLLNSKQAQALIQNLILTKGQPDREQFVVALLQCQERNDQAQYRVRGNALIGPSLTS